MDQYFSKELMWVFPNGPRLLKCPFLVICIEATGDLLLKKFYRVEEVISEPGDAMLFVIEGVAYSYKHFTVIYIDPSRFNCLTPIFPDPE